MAEWAVTLPAVVLVLGVALAGVDLVTDQLRCVDAARVAARAASRGDDPAEVLEAARRLAPPGARVSTSTADGLVTVTVRGSAGPASRWLPDVVDPGAEAVAPREEGL